MQQDSALPLPVVDARRHSELQQLLQRRLAVRGAGRIRADHGLRSLPRPAQQYISNGGIHLINGNMKVKDVTDGTSNTMSFGEYSDAAPGQNWSPHRSHRDASHPWAMGYINTSLGAFTYGPKTVAHPPNSAAYWTYSWSVPRDLEQPSTRPL